MAQQTLTQKTTHPPATFNHSKIQRDLFIRRVGKVGLLINPLVSYFFLWAPIVVLIIFSFNDAGGVTQWRGFTTKWYTNIFNNALTAGSGSASFTTELLLQSVKNSMIVSISATVISTIIGTMLALSLARGRYPGKDYLDTILYLPVVIPEITQGISLLVFFNILFRWLEPVGINLRPGFGTIIIAHVAFNISFVTIVVRARLADMNPRLEEAARDLGANEWQTFWRITFPLIAPGILAGALLAFTLSLDDFVVTFFTTGIGNDTLTIFVYGMLKQRVPPEINAISTIMLLVSTILVGLSLMLQGRSVNQSRIKQ
ncbi:MAG: ABC transporter permease [Chloroflexi bacterium]|nr:MAG: spermidine/putrescine ABC transporter permease PotC [Phototrophicales bacterium]RMF78903.1 MAG: ABC transporter permease [Chloroflexota bacterium]